MSCKADSKRERTCENLARAEQGVNDITHLSKGKSLAAISLTFRAARQPPEPEFPQTTEVFTGRK